MNQVRMNVEEDRISILSDDLILKILSLVGIKDAVKTSVLSPRWRYVWTSIPHLTFSCEDFTTMDKLANFVFGVLSRRSNQAPLSSVNLIFRAFDVQNVASDILNSLLSLDLQQANIKCLFGNFRTLKHNIFRMPSGYGHFLLESTRELSSLTTLHLDYIRLHDGFFSKCPNLENLTLICCTMMGSIVLRICHPRLSNLAIDNRCFLSDTTSVVTPQLKSLTITHIRGHYQISAPNLASLLLKGDCPFTFSTDGFRSLEKAQLSLHILCSSQVKKRFHFGEKGQLSLGVLSFSHASSIISLLQKLHNVKVLSLSMDIIQILNSSLELISHQPSPFAHLKSLKILPIHLGLCNCGHTRLIMSTEVKNYLLNSSPKATLTEMAVDLKGQLCEFVGLDIGSDGFFYCRQCGRQASEIGDTVVAADDTP